MAQNYLSENSQDKTILVRALRRLPQLNDITVAFLNEIIGAREIMSALSLLNGNEVTLDSEYTLPVLIEALSEAKREIKNFRLIPDQGKPLERYNLSRRDFNNNQPRFKYVSESPAMLTNKAFLNAFTNDVGTKAFILVSGLRELNISGFRIDIDNLSGLPDLNTALKCMVVSSRRLETLRIWPRIYGIVRGNLPRLQLSEILHYSINLSYLQQLELHLVEFSEPFLVGLLIQCSCSLKCVGFSNACLASNGSWSDILRQLRKVDWKVLDKFLLISCGGMQGFVYVQDYLKRITDKEPIPEANGASETSE